VEHAVTLRIVLEKPPPGVDIGVQEGKGNDYQTIQTQRSRGADLRFEITVRARAGVGGAPNFLGPFAHGPAGGRFLYLDIGTYAGQTGTPWSRRLKIPLVGISWGAIRDGAGTPAIFEARLAGTGKDGGPSCGTANPFAGWKPARRGRR
jgi:hypothetical protein